MKKLFALAPLALLVASCCPRPTKVVDPPYPTVVHGWKYHAVNGTGMVADLVVRKSGATDNGEVRITVLDLMPAESCVDLGTSQAFKRVTLKFSRVADNKSVCEVTLTDKNGGNVCNSALGEFRISGIGIRDINITDEWVHFVLSGYDKD